MQAPIHPDYLDATVRCVLPVCGVRLRFALAFDIPGLPPIRLALTPEHAELLATGLRDYINEAAGSQKPMSRLISSDPMSVPSDGGCV